MMSTFPPNWNIPTQLELKNDHHMPNLENADSETTRFDQGEAFDGVKAC